MIRRSGCKSLPGQHRVCVGWGRDGVWLQGDPVLRVEGRGRGLEGPGALGHHLATWRRGEVANGSHGTGQEEDGDE